MRNVRTLPVEHGKEFVLNALMMMTMMMRTMRAVRKGMRRTRIRNYDNSCAMTPATAADARRSALTTTCATSTTIG